MTGTAVVIEFGLDTPAYLTDDEHGGLVAGDQVIRDVIDEAVLAEQVGFDSFAIAEHYRPDLMDTAASVILAAMAARTTRIRPGTAVTVLSTRDPVRVSHEYPTLDAVSNGHAPLIVPDRATDQEAADVHPPRASGPTASPRRPTPG